MYFALLVAFLIAAKTTLGARVLNCPHDQVKFEKILGLRPSDTVNSYLLHKNDHYEPVTLDCVAKCSALEKCRSFVLYYNISQCYWYSDNPEGLQEIENVVIDSDVGWFSKTCLVAPDHCNKTWIFERIPGSTLIGSNTKTLPGTVTRDECQQHCLNETEIKCRSTKFKISDEANSIDVKGVCTLSITDRHFNPNAYRASGYNEEYFENQCSNVTRNEFCAYEEYDSVILSHIDYKFAKKTKTECEELCESTEFTCRGYSLIPTAFISAPESDVNTCLIHSEDSKVHGPRLLQYTQSAKYYEKARCINVTVTCSNSLLIVRYQPDTQFNGKIYMNGYSNNLECYAIGKNKQLVQLKIPLFNNNCGVTEAKSINHFNRSLFSGDMIIQYNPILQTQGDRLIKVGCVFSNESKVILGTGVSFNNTASSSAGTTIINSTTVHPVVEMRIVDYYTQVEIGDSQIGQELQLIIEIKPPDGPYDIWAGHLLAMTDDVNDSILLLDDQGCPTNINIFPALTKIYNNETRRLVANFQAFKFTSSPIVKFSVIVQFCPIQCPPINCGNQVSNARKKRNATQMIETLNGTTIVPINKQQYDSQGKPVAQLPLELVLVVRNTKPIPDRLVYGENKILIAGYDYVTDEVCLDYSLFIGLIIIWVIMQVILVIVCVLIIRHYKRYYAYQQNVTQSLEELNKNFGFGFSNLEPRRVHWADNDYT